MALAVTVSGNKLVDANGEPLQLRGCNMSGLEQIAVQGGDVATWDGTIPNWPVYKTWGVNAVRLPLNAGSWLGLTTYNAHGNPATSWGSAVNCDPQGDYKATVLTAIAAAQAQGLYVILDLHWSCPEVTLGGVTHYITPDGQPEFMNASTDITFWTDMANMFGTQATPQAGINNHAILFELFNEPYINYYASGATLWGLMLNGGTVATFTWSVGAYSVTPTGGAPIAGYQQVLNAIRATGATNVCIINSLTFTQSAESYPNWMPADTLVPAQLAVGWHPYPSGTYPYSDGNVYGQTGGDAGQNTPTFAQWYEAILADGVPVLITEDGGQGGTSASSGEPHMAYMQNWANQNGVSYFAWEWTETQTRGITETNNYTCTYAADGVTIVPIEGEGVQVYNWLGGASKSIFFNTD